MERPGSLFMGRGAASRFPSFGGAAYLRRSTGWYIAGLDQAAPANLAGNTTLQFQSALGNDMIAVPEFFVEDGEITGLAMLTVAVAAGEVGWMGIARNQRVSADHLPGATAASVALANNGLGAGVAAFSGATISLFVSAGDVLWFVYQYNAAGGKQHVAIPNGVFRSLFGFQNVEGLSPGPGVASGVSNNDGVRPYIYYLANPAPAYLVGRNFPASPALALKDGTTTAPYGNATTPAMWFKFVRR